MNRDLAVTMSSDLLDVGADLPWLREQRDAQLVHDALWDAWGNSCFFRGGEHVAAAAVRRNADVAPFVVYCANGSGKSQTLAHLATAATAQSGSGEYFTPRAVVRILVRRLDSLNRATHPVPTVSALSSPVAAPSEGIDGRGRPPQSLNTVPASLSPTEVALGRSPAAARLAKSMADASGQPVSAIGRARKMLLARLAGAFMAPAYHHLVQTILFHLATALGARRWRRDASKSMHMRAGARAAAAHGGPRGPNITLHMTRSTFIGRKLRTL